MHELGSNFYNFFRYISQTQGLPTEHMLNSASKTEKFFYRDEDSTYPFWRLISPEENEIMTNVKSKEARKYIFNCLDDIGQVNVQMDIESSQLLAEKIDRREFIDLLKRMLTIDQERRIQPAQALRHPFVTLSHLVDYAHCNNVKASVQMMEVCRRDPVIHSVPQTTATLVTNFGPNTTENMTFTINNQLNQVQRLVRERNPSSYENVYQFYGTPNVRNVVRQYANTRAAEVLPPQLSFICPYNPMPSPTTKHVVVGSAGMQPSLQVPPQQYVNVPVPVSMTMEPNGQRMLLTNAVQSSVAWPQGSTRQVAIVPNWSQHGTAPHSLIVDSQFYNVEEIYGKQPLSIHKYEKKESPVHHLNVPRHDKKETNQLSPVKKRVKENTPPNHHHHHQNQNLQQNQARYNNHRSSSYHHHVSPQQTTSSMNQYHPNQAFYGSQGQQLPAGYYDPNQAYSSAGVINTSGKQRRARNQTSTATHHQIVNSTITIHDTPSPPPPITQTPSVILISDSEDEEENQKKQQSTKNSREKTVVATNNNQGYTSTTNSSTQCSKNDSQNSTVISSNNNNNQQRKQVITVGDSDGEDTNPKQGQQQQQQQHSNGE